MRYKLIGISWVYKGRRWWMTSSSADFFLLPCAYLGCQDAADPAFRLKPTGISSEQSMQGQILHNTFKEAYDGPRSSVFMIISCIHVDICCINGLQALQTHEPATI